MHFDPTADSGCGLESWPSSWQRAIFISKGCLSRLFSVGTPWILNGSDLPTMSVFVDSESVCWPCLLPFCKWEWLGAGGMDFGRLEGCIL
jgi:hypothetical protein